MLCTFQVLKNGQPTKHTVFAASAESKQDAEYRIRKANLLGDGETLGELIEDQQESEAA